MISVSAGGDFRYYLDAANAPRENYYTAAVSDAEPAGRWAGRGAEALGLLGGVSAEAMEALYAHRIDPRDDRFRERSEWGHAPRLGGPPRRYATAEEIYARMLAAEPGASGERQEELRLNAERSARSSVQYVDVTYSLPKSVTVLHAAFERQQVEAERAGDPEAAAAWRAHRDAVEAAGWAGNTAALDYLQDQAGYSRVGHHGGAAGRYVDAHDWVVTSFLQHDSRDGDPQLHIHNPILNLVQCADGQWRTLDSRGIHRHRPAAAAIAERVTEEHLSRTLGLRFATRPDGKAREVVGVPAEVLELFSSRRRAITPTTERLVDQFTGRFGRQPNALELDRLQRQATLATRQAKTRSGETVGERLDRWDAALRGEVADGLAAVARSVLGQVDESATPPRWSPTVVAETALAEVQAARSTWTRPELTRAVSGALPDGLGGLDAPAVRRLLDGLTDRALMHATVKQIAGERDTDRPQVPELLLANGASAYQGPASRRYALIGHLHAERALQRSAVDTGAPALSGPAAEAAITKLAGEGMTFGADQQRVLVAILISGAKVETLTGPAGTGKSTVVGGLARIWSDPETWSTTRPDGGHARGRVFGLASSQVATEVLAAEGLPARNVTRWLDTQQRLGTGSHDRKDLKWPLTGRDLVVVDEAAMLSTADLTAIHQRTEEAGAKLLLTGDHRQLAAVGAGGGMQLLAKAGGHELAEVRRFTADWEGPASLRLRDGDDTVLHAYRQHGRLIDAGTPEQARASAARAWLADTVAGKQSVLVVDTNENAARLSADVRAQLVRLGRVTEDGVPLGRDGTLGGVGDLVQARRNGWELLGHHGNTRAPINRQIYRVVATTADGGIVVEPADAHRTRDSAGESAGDSSRRQLVLPAEYVAADLTLGYATTVHSIQGRTVDTAHVVVDASTSPDALYVSLSRGRDANHAHVITHAANEQQPAGAAHSTSRVDPLAVLVNVVRADSDTRPAADAAAAATEQADDDERRRQSMQTAAQRHAFAADSSDTGALARLLRTAELAGHKPDHVLAGAATARTLDGARSLPQVLYRRIEQHLDGRLTPTATTYADMVPAVTSPAWREQLTSGAEAADKRRRELGTRTADELPQWAVEALGPVPADPVARLDWEHRAGAAAAWRELGGHGDPADALGAPPRPGQPEHYAAWRTAWTALGRPEADRADAELSDGQLRIRVRAHTREENWAPAYVGESLTATNLAADARRRDATLTAARAEAADDPAEAARLHQESTDADALADLLADQVRQLEHADQARGNWLAHTAATRGAADRARAELAARGAPLGAEADDAVTAEEWLAAHRAEQAEADQHRPVTDEHDLTDITARRDADMTAACADADFGACAEAALPDIRDSVTEPVNDEPGRVPDANESQAAIRRAQAALVEIEQRRALDEQHAAEHRRAEQLSQWAADDRDHAAARSDRHIDAAALGH